MQGFQNLQTDISFDEASRMFNAVPVKVQTMLQQKGFGGPSSPPSVQDHTTGQTMPFNGRIPSDLTQLNDDWLGYYLGLLSGWIDYVQQQLAEAHASMRIANEKLEFVNAHLLMIHKKDGDKKRPEPERKAMVLIDRRFVEAQAEAIYHETFYRHVKAIADSAEQSYSAVSRRISQRQQDIERQKRQTSVGNISGPLFHRP